MAIFATANSSGYSDPLKALSIKALEQRQKDLLAQQAAQQPDPAMMATIPGGIGSVLGIVGDNMKQGRADAALAAQKETLARTMAGVDWDKGPTAQQVAVINSADPELARQALSTLAENRRAATQVAATTRGQDVTAASTARGQDVTARGQDIQSADTIRGQDVTTRGQDIQSADTIRGQDVTTRGQDIQSADTTRGQDLTATTAARGQDITTRGQDIQSADTIRGQDVTTRGQDMTQGTTVRGQDMTSSTADLDRASREKNAQVVANAAAADPVKAEARMKIEDIHTQRAAMSAELDSARDLLKKGINLGRYAGFQTGLAQGSFGLLGDKEQADRTAQFDATMDKVATGAMSTILKGSSTDKEMAEFKTQYNSRLVSQEAKRVAFQRVLDAAKRDQEVSERAVKATGGDTSNPITPPPAAAPAVAGPAAKPAGMSDEAIRSEAQQHLKTATPEQAAQINSRLKAWGLQ